MKDWEQLIWKKKSKCLNYSATYLGLNEPEAKISKCAIIGGLKLEHIMVMKNELSSLVPIEPKSIHYLQIVLVWAENIYSLHTAAEPLQNYKT